MLHWLHAYITSEPPAWINYSSPCHNTEDALIMTDSQTRQRSKWRGENTHDLHWVCNFIVWLLREHLQMRHVSPPALMGVCFLKKNSPGHLESTQAYRAQVKSFHVGSRWAVVIPGQAVDGRYILLRSALLFFRHVSSLASFIKAGGADWLQRFVQTLNSIVQLDLSVRTINHQHLLWTTYILT